MKCLNVSYKTEERQIFPLADDDYKNFIKHVWILWMVGSDQPLYIYIYIDIASIPWWHLNINWIFVLVFFYARMSYLYQLEEYNNWWNSLSNFNQPECYCLFASSCCGKNKNYNMLHKEILWYEIHTLSCT